MKNLRAVAPLVLVLVAIIVLFLPVWPVQSRIFRYTINESVQYGDEYRPALCGPWVLGGFGGNYTLAEKREWMAKQDKFASPVASLVFCLDKHNLKTEAVFNDIGYTVVQDNENQ